MSSPKKDDFVKYLSDLRAPYATYHNHKELSAWGGVALYVIVCAQLTFAPQDVFKNDTLVYAGAILFVLFSVSVLIYVGCQLWLRRVASDYTAAALRLGAEWSLRDEEMNQADWEVERVPDAWHHSPSVLPKAIRNEASAMQQIGRKTRRLLEFAAYSVVAVGFFAVALRVFVERG